MVITSSLARGLVRDAVARHSERCHRVWRRLSQSRLRAPASLRRFREWFETHQRAFQDGALLIAYGRVGRRRGVFTSFMPAFSQTDLGWVLMIDRLRIACEPGRIVQIDSTRLPLRVCGHALERMFQRGETIAWADVRDALADALVFYSGAHRAYAEGGYLQGPLPVSGGLLAGQFAEGVLELKTFLPDGTLGPRRRLAERFPSAARHRCRGLPARRGVRQRRRDRGGLELPCCRSAPVAAPAARAGRRLGFRCLGESRGRGGAARVSAGRSHSE